MGSELVRRWRAIFGATVNLLLPITFATIFVGAKIVDSKEAVRETKSEMPLLLEYDGDLQTVTPSNKLAYLPFDDRVPVRIR